MSNKYTILDCGNVADVSHQRIHNGQSFFAGHYSASVADTASLSLLIETGATPIHIIFGAAIGGDGTSTITEGVTATAGTALTEFNKNRVSAKSSSVTVTHTPTGVSGGTTFPTQFIPGGTSGGGGGGMGGGTSVGGQDGGFDREVVLNINTKYRWVITNISGATQPVSMAVEWYEPDL